MSIKILKISILLAIASVSGCSTYMAPWEKPNPYHYEVMPAKPTIEYKPASSIEFQNQNVIQGQYIGPTIEEQSYYKNSKNEQRRVRPNSSIQAAPNDSYEQAPVQYVVPNQPSYQQQEYINVPVE